MRISGCTRSENHQDFYADGEEFCQHAKVLATSVTRQVKYRPINSCPDLLPIITRSDDGYDGDVTVNVWLMLRFIRGIGRFTLRLQI